MQEVVTDFILYSAKNTGHRFTWTTPLLVYIHDYNDSNDIKKNVFEMSDNK